MTYSDLSKYEKSRFENCICIYCKQKIKKYEMFSYNKRQDGRFKSYIWWHLKCEEDYHKISNQLEGVSNGTELKKIE